MKYYKIKTISQMTGLSIRAFQYYDDIGLLQPSQRNDAGYRLYSERDLLQLQYVVTLKFLGFPLNSIQASSSAYSHSRRFNHLSCLTNRSGRKHQLA